MTSANFSTAGKLLRGQQTLTSITCLVNIGKVLISLSSLSLEGGDWSFGLVGFAFVLFLGVAAHPNEAYPCAY